MRTRTQGLSGLCTSEEVASESAETEKSASRKRHGRNSVRRLAAILAILGCVYLCRAPGLRSIVEPLIVDEQTADPDYVWIRTEDGISCDGDRGYDQAARLYHEDTSRRIILTKPSPSRLAQIGAVSSFDVISWRELAARGVRKDAIVPIDGTWQNPWQEARRIGTWLKERPDAELLLLCDRFNSRRWWYILDKVLEADTAGAVQILALPDRRYNETNWWKSRRGVKDLFYGYVRLAYAWCQGENIPERECWDPDEYERILHKAVREG